MAKWKEICQDDLREQLIGRRVVEVTRTKLILDDGVQVKFEESEADCCSWQELKSLQVTENIITDVRFEDNEDKTGGEGAYKARIVGVTEAGEVNIAKAIGDASNGYYLHGWALKIWVKRARRCGGDSEAGS